MEYTKLGKTDITISKLCVGAMSFGKPSEDFHTWTLGEAETDAMVKKALELGYNFFDTANTYAHGTSEEYLGKALRKYARREDVVIATKVYFNEGHLSKEAINREIDLSLKRLGTDYVDLYIIHRFDYTTPIEETMEALDSLVKKGKVRALGASAMYGYQFFKMQLVARDNNLTPFSSMQNHYNLIYREDERELIPICKEMGVSLTPYSPLAAGRLSRVDRNYESKRNREDKVAVGKYDATRDIDQPIIDRVKELSERYGVSMTDIVFAWHWKKGISSPIIGATKEKYLEDAVRAFGVKLTDEDVTYLEDPYLPHKVVGAL